MKNIQLKDASGDSLFPYTRWPLINDKPSFLNATSVADLVNIIFCAIPNYNSSRSQVLQHDSDGFKWVNI